MTTNKFQYFGIYKPKEALEFICYYKVVDVVTHFVVRWHPNTNTSGEYVSFYSCDAGGVYVSPRSWGTPIEECLCQPFIYPLDKFLTLFEKYDDKGEAKELT